MNKGKAFGAAIAAVAMTTMGAGLALRLQRGAPSDRTAGVRPLTSPPVQKTTAGEGQARTPAETSPSRPAAPPPEGGGE